jgi:hypothetical protein
MANADAGIIYRFFILDSPRYSDQFLAKSMRFPEQDHPVLPILFEVDMFCSMRKHRAVLEDEHHDE